MTPLDSPILDAWRINDRVTAFLVEQLPPALWRAALPSSPRRTVGSIFAHLHNARRMWLRSLGVGTRIAIPPLADRAASRRDLRAALGASGAAILALLESGLRNGGRFPGVTSAFFYGAMPRDTIHFLGYALSHEAHHRGQVLLMARSLGHRLPPKVTGGLWQWSSRLKESRPKRASKA
ncbi:MAG TPA: DinB family protein [Candidatus Saccharimonadales bacterium]|nr:DinB family protein [Candidatus Saccharimonadales bacterium]